MKTTIGFELHAQLTTKTKLFCSCSTDYFQAPPNTNTCPICLGMPGVLPVLNKKAVDYALNCALALNCRIPTRCKFDRKNYFYPDLPKGYQISQYDEPLAIDGHMDIEIDGKVKRIRIRRVHLEEDAGKLVHVEDASLVDFNRAGVPLIEIVTEPDITSPQEGRVFIEDLRQLLRYLGICEGDMEKGHLRCEPNISVSPEEDKLGVKTELKNLNSFKAVEEALKFEEKRQVKALQEGGEIKQQTLRWDPDENKATSMRSKEEAQDYRYFPEPDLTPLEVRREWVTKVKRNLPELPQEKRKRWEREYELPNYDIQVLTEELEIANYFEEVVGSFNHPKEVSNWIMSELLRLIKEDDKDLKTIPLRSSDLVEVLKMVDQGEVNRNTGKEIVEEAFKTGKTPREIVEERDLTQISDQESLQQIVNEVINENQEAVEDYKKGKDKVLGFLIGQVMAKTRGKADPTKTRQIIIEKLSQEENDK